MPTRIFLGVLFAAIFFFVFPFSVFAALIITDVSPTVINSADETITISASASGLSNATQYLQVALTREGTSTNYLGLTKNLGGEWYLYKSSPVATDLSGYFYNFTPLGSTWSGQIQAKVDINDDGFLGPGNYILKLIKYISSSGTASNNTFIITVNIASPSSQAQDESEDTSLAPEIGVSLNDNLFLGEEFPIKLTLKNFDSNQDYYLKFRAGVDENSLTKAQTKNGSAFYGDSESWSKFPEVATDGSGKFEGQIMGRINEDKPSGQYYVRIRVHKKDGDTFYDSATKTVQLAIPPVVVTNSPVATKTATADGTINTSTDEIDLILGTASAATVSPIVSTGIPVNQVPKGSSIFPVAIIFVVLGTTLSSLALLSVKFRIWEKWLFWV